jgi:hypothetical protein
MLRGQGENLGCTRARGAIAELRGFLLAADRLYHDPSTWKQLGAKEVPPIPTDVIVEAVLKGGRIILRCSSLSEKIAALEQKGHDVSCGPTVRLCDYKAHDSKPEWIVVHSYIDRGTVGSLPREGGTLDMPRPNTADWFAALAYAKLRDGAQPMGCENGVVVTDPGTHVGSSPNEIYLECHDPFGTFGVTPLSTASFGYPPK